MTLCSVRYIDYGNKSDYLSRGDIYTWDTLLEKIPSQSVACSFYRVPEHISEMTSMTMEDMEVFSSLMKQSSPMNGLRTWGGTSCSPKGLTKHWQQWNIPRSRRCHWLY